MFQAKLGLAAMVFAGFLACAPAHADSKSETDPTDVIGTWSFQTKPYRGGECMMSGTMYLSPHPEDGQYACELTAVEVCSMWGRSVVRQSCQARRFGNQIDLVIIRRKVCRHVAVGLVYHNYIGGQAVRGGQDTQVGRAPINHEDAQICL